MDTSTTPTAPAILDQVSATDWLLTQRQAARELADRLEVLIDTAQAHELSAEQRQLLEEATTAACRCLDHLNRLLAPETAPAPLPGPAQLLQLDWLYYPATLHLAAWDHPTPDVPPGAWAISAEWYRADTGSGDEIRLRLTYARDWRDLDITTDHDTVWSVGAMRNAIRCTALEPLIRSLLADLLTRACRHDPALPQIALHARPTLVVAEG